MKLMANVEVDVDESMIGGETWEPDLEEIQEWLEDSANVDSGIPAITVTIDWSSLRHA